MILDRNLILYFQILVANRKIFLMMEKNTPVNNRFEWSSNMTFKLIKMYEDNPSLWNPNDELYINRANRDEIISNMASIFATNTHEIKRKIHNLRNQYNQMEIRATKLRETGREFKTKWIYFDNMKFLRSYITRTPLNYSTDEVILSTNVGEDKDYDNDSRDTIESPNGTNMFVKTESISNKRPQIVENIEIKELRRISPRHKQNSNNYMEDDDFDETDGLETEEYVIVPSEEGNNSNIILDSSAIKRKRETNRHNLNKEKPSNQGHSSNVYLIDGTLKNDCGNHTTTRPEVDDEFSVFGQFIANELHSMKQPKHMRKLKRMIQKAILEVSEMDDKGD